ncbi:MAG: Rpp14/Pop5 family protein, partial [Chloroflexota bacterium]
DYGRGAAGEGNMTKFRVKPTQKENWRYIAFEIISDSAPKEGEVVRTMVSSILRFLGELGASDTNIWMMEYAAEKRQGIIRCSHDAVRDVVASITLVSKIEEKKAAFNVRGVSGTVKKCREKYLISVKNER